MDSPEKSVPSETGETGETFSDGNVQNSEHSTRKLGGITGKGFMPGVSGNPGGRPKKLPITEMFQQMYEQYPEQIKECMMGVMTGKSAVAKVMLVEKMAERMEGKVVQPVEGDINLNLGISDRLIRAKERLDTDE